MNGITKTTTIKVKVTNNVVGSEEKHKFKITVIDCTDLNISLLSSSVVGSITSYKIGHPTENILNFDAFASTTSNNEAIVYSLDDDNSSLAEIPAESELIMNLENIKTKGTYTMSIKARL